MTAEALKAAERSYQEAFRKAEQLREARNSLIRQAVEAGWTHAQIAQATGLTRSRVGQIG